MTNNLHYTRSLAIRGGLYDKFMPINYDLSLREAWDLSNTKPGMKVIDIGCGSGRILDHANEDIHFLSSFTACDIDSKVFKIIKKRSKSERINFINADISNNEIFNKLKNKKFDRLFCLFTFYVIPKKHQEQALINMSSLIKEDGLLIMTLPTNKYSATSILSDANSEHQKRDSKYTLSDKFILKYILKHWLRKIETNIRKEVFSCYNKEYFHEKFADLGFTILKELETYGGNAIHIIAKKNKRY